MNIKAMKIAMNRMISAVETYKLKRFKGENSIVCFYKLKDR